MNEFVKCAMIGWSYTKGILHNSNKWAVIGIKPILEYFSQYMDKRGDKQHYFGVEVSLKTYYHHIFTTTSKLF